MGAIKTFQTQTIGFLALKLQFAMLIVCINKDLVASMLTIRSVDGHTYYTSGLINLTPTGLFAKSCN